MVGMLLYLVCLPIELASAMIRFYTTYMVLALGGVFVANAMGNQLNEQLGIALLGIALVIAAAPILWSVVTLLGFPGGSLLTRWQLGARTPTNQEQAAVADALQTLRASNPHAKGPWRWFVIDQPTPNALVIGTTLYVERGLITSGYLEPVLAHELGHLNSLDGRLVLALRRFVVPPMYWLSAWLGKAADRYNENWQKSAPLWSRNSTTIASYGCVGALILIPLGLLRILFLFSGGGYSAALLRLIWPLFVRQREYRADAYAARLNQGFALADFLGRYALAQDVAIPYYREQTHPYTPQRIDRLLNYQPAQSGRLRSPLLQSTTLAAAVATLLLVGSGGIAFGIHSGALPFNLPSGFAGLVLVASPTPAPVIVATSAIAPQPLQAPASGATVRRLRVAGVAPQKLLVRAEPRLDAAIMARLVEGSVVEFIAETSGQNKRWYRIRSSGAEGWSSADYLQDVP